MVRGVERRAIVRDERDRADLVDRVAALAEAKALGLPPTALPQDTRARPVVQARAAVSAVAGPLLGLLAPRVAAALGITQLSVLRGIARGRDLLAARSLDHERLARELLR